MNEFWAGPRLRSVMLALLALANLHVVGQTPQSISYQSVIRHPNGLPVVGAPVGLRVRLLQGSPQGTVVYEEVFSAVTSNVGLVNLAIGAGEATVGSFAEIPWASGLIFMELGVDDDGGTNFVVAGTQQLLSVPYALYADHAGSSATPGPPGPQGLPGEPGPPGPPGP